MAIRDFPGCRPVHARLAIRDDSKTEANERSIRRNLEGTGKRVEKKEPQKPNDSNGFRGSNQAEKYEIP